MKKGKLAILILLALIMASVLPIWTENNPADVQASWADALTKAVNQVKEKKWDGVEFETRKQGQALADQLGPAAIDWLTAKVSDKTGNYAQQVPIWALGFISSRESVTRLISIIKSVHWNSKIVVLAIANADPENARWGLEQILLNQEWWLQIVSCDLLRTVGDEKTLGILDTFRQKKRIDVDLLEHVEKTRLSILYRLEEIKNQNERKVYANFERVFWEAVHTAPNLVSRKSSDMYAVKQISVQWPDKISEKFLSRKLDTSLSDSDEIRVTAYLCGLLKDARMLGTLIKLSKDREFSAARWAMAQIGGQEVADILEQILTDEEPTGNMQNNMIICGTEKNAASLEAKISKETDPERIKAYKNAVEGIRTRLKEEQEKNKQTPKSK